MRAGGALSSRRSRHASPTRSRSRGRAHARAALRDPSRGRRGGDRTAAAAGPVGLARCRAVLPDRGDPRAASGRSCRFARLRGREIPAAARRRAPHRLRSRRRRRPDGAARGRSVRRHRLCGGGRAPAHVSGSRVPPVRRRSCDPVGRSCCRRRTRPRSRAASGSSRAAIRTSRSGRTSGRQDTSASTPGQSCARFSTRGGFDVTEMRPANYFLTGSRKNRVLVRHGEPPAGRAAAGDHGHGDEARPLAFPHGGGFS